MKRVKNSNLCQLKIHILFVLKIVNVRPAFSPKSGAVIGCVHWYKLLKVANYKIENHFQFLDKLLHCSAWDPFKFSNSIRNI